MGDKRIATRPLVAFITSSFLISASLIGSARATDYQVGVSYALSPNKNRWYCNLWLSSGGANGWVLNPTFSFDYPYPGDSLENDFDAAYEYGTQQKQGVLGDSRFKWENWVLSHKSEIREGCIKSQLGGIKEFQDQKASGFQTETVTVSRGDRIVIGSFGGS
jgi:hypothetical protein